MVRGYRPVINTLAKGIDIRLHHRFAQFFILAILACYSIENTIIRVSKFQSFDLWALEL
jgi:hypothetical protein